MRIAITGGTGFVGRYILRELAPQNSLRAWYRTAASREGLEDVAADWVQGELGDREASRELVQGCDAVVHSALYHPGGGFRGGEGDLIEFAQRNIIGSLELMEAAREAGVKRFIFISTCAVHEKILDDRPLDETHPLWALSHYGAHKAAIEKFVHSYGLGMNWPICALRPTGVYGVAHPAEDSKWYGLIERVVRGEPVECTGGGKEVHAADVAKAVAVLLSAPEDRIRGEAFACYDRYVSQYEVAETARRLSGSKAEIRGSATKPRNEIVTEKIRALGMQFGGTPLLEQTIADLIAHIRG
jgi:nucleoside-diphosphate-sugar epimerase